MAGDSDFDRPVKFVCEEVINLVSIQTHMRVRTGFYSGFCVCKKNHVKGEEVGVRGDDCIGVVPVRQFFQNLVRLLSLLRSDFLSRHEDLLHVGEQLTENWKVVGNIL